MAIIGSQASLFRTFYPLLLAMRTNPTQVPEDKSLVSTVRQLTRNPGRTRKRLATDFTEGGLSESEATLYRGGVLWPF